jgi:hypothetical protein
MSDLIERLRGMKEYWQHAPLFTCHSLHNEAADEIELLEAEKADIVNAYHDYAAFGQEREMEFIAKIERLTKIEKAAIALRDDMILRADMGTFDGEHAVQAGASVWRNFCNALDVGKIIHCNQRIPRGVEE